MASHEQPKQLVLFLPRHICVNLTNVDVLIDHVVAHLCVVVELFVHRTQTLNVFGHVGNRSVDFVVGETVRDVSETVQN